MVVKKKKQTANAAVANRRQTLRRCQSSKKPELQDIEDLFSEDETEKIREALLKWYGLNRRDLPWREEEEDVDVRVYRVWVSEVMLQQTRVQTVIQYFNRWMSKWPTIHSLAQASLEEVNEMWAGLGYYRRARFLLEGARKIVAEGDQFPKTVSQLQKIPGIGDYTAGAIASIALKEAVPVVDGNVIRVIARLKAIAANPKDSLTVKKFWKLAAQLVDPFQPGDFNQALMELGATLCTPTSPSCGTCPVSDQCSALSISRHDSSVVVTDYPVKVVKTKQRHDFSAVCVVEILGDEESSNGHQINNKFLLVKRPDEGLLAGLWEFPSVSLAGEVGLVPRRKAIDQYLNKYFTLNPRKTCDIVSREHVGEYVHVFSHIRLKMYVESLILRVEGGMNDLVSKRDKEIVPWKCVDAEVLSNMGLTSGVRKVYTMVQKLKQEKSSSDPDLDIKKRKRPSIK
ncbi:adenine DNA glycosylase [Rosa sericea]